MKSPRSNVPVVTMPAPHTSGSALHPLASEVSWVALRLAGADPAAINDSADLLAAGRAFARILEIGAMPGRAVAAVDLHASSPDEPLELHLLLGNCGSAHTTAAEAVGFANVARRVLAAYPSVYRLMPADPKPLFELPDHHSALIRQRTLMVADAEDSVSVLSRFDREADHWLALAGSLLDCAPVRLRIVLLADEMGLSDYAELRTELGKAQRMRERAHDDPEIARRATRAANTLLDILESYRSPVFCFEAALLSESRLPETLVRATAAALTRELDVTRGGETPTVAARERILGGFTIETDPRGHKDALACGLPLHGGCGPRGLADLVSLTEAACVFQLPIPAGGPIPTVPTRVAAELPAPSGLPSAGTRIGLDCAGDPVFLDEEMTRCHIHVLGETGSGKTTAMLVFMRNDLANGRFFVFIDPHGTAARQVTTLASALGREVVVIDPADPGTLSIALFEGVTADGVQDPEALERSISRIIDAFTSLYPSEWSGPRFRAAARAALTLIAYAGRGCGLADVGRVLTDEVYRMELMMETSDLPEWTGSFLRTFSRQHENADVAQWVSSKFDDIAMRGGLRRVFAPAGSGVTFAELMSRGVPVVVDLAKGYLSSLDARLLGHVVMASVVDAAFQRPDNDRSPFSVYVDESHTFPPENLVRALIEGRKFGVSLAMSHQHLSQLDDSVQDAVLGSPSVRFAFRLAPSDAGRLAPSFGVTARDLAGQSDLHAYVRCAPQGRALPAFTLELPSVTDILSDRWMCSAAEGDRAGAVAEARRVRERRQACETRG